jgi:hypothetical protein
LKSLFSRLAPWTLPLVVFSTGASAAAQGAKRVAVLTFSGPQAPRARAIVTSAVGQHAVNVTETEMSDARRQLGGNLESDANLANFATLCAADALVDGSIRRERRRWVLVVLVRSGQDGSVVGRAVFPMRNLGGLASVGGAVWGRIGEFVQASAGSGGGAVATATQDTRDDGSDSATTNESDTGQSWTPSTAVGQSSWGSADATSADSATDPAQGPPPDSSISETVSPEEPSETPAGSTAELLDVEGDLSMINRTYSVPVGDEPNPRRYDGGGPELGLGARAYFLALAGLRGTLSAFHVYVGYRRHLSLVTRGTGVSGNEVSAATGENQIELGVALPFRFSEGVQAASLGPYAGYGRLEFSLDATDMATFEETSRLPTMAYGYLVVGAQLLVPLAPPWLQARVAGGYRSVLDVGDEARAALGPDTAGGSGYVLAGGLGGDLAFLVSGLYWMLRAEYFTFSAQFEGDGGSYGPGGLSEDAYWRAGGLVGWRLEG